MAPTHTAPRAVSFWAVRPGRWGWALRQSEELEEVIPLKTVVATPAQKGLLEAPRSRFLQGENGFKRNLFCASDVGPSNLFFVRGDDIDEVMETTLFALADGLAIDRLVVGPSRRKEPSKRLWAFVYFGAAQPSPPEWAITRASIQRDRVRVAVTRPEPGLGHDFALVSYMFWVPLGERKEKAFTLQAYDETNRVTLMTRYVVV